MTAYNVAGAVMRAVSEQVEAGEHLHVTHEPADEHDGEWIDAAGGLAAAGDGGEFEVRTTDDQAYRVVVADKPARPPQRTPRPWDGKTREELAEILERVHELHVESPAGFCPSCGRLDDVSDTDDGLVAFPCPTLEAMGEQPDGPLPRWDRGYTVVRLGESGGADADHLH